MTIPVEKLIKLIETIILIPTSFLSPRPQKKHIRYCRFLTPIPSSSSDRIWSQMCLTSTAVVRGRHASALTRMQMMHALCVSSHVCDINIPDATACVRRNVRPDASLHAGFRPTIRNIGCTRPRTLGSYRKQSCARRVACDNRRDQRRTWHASTSQRTPPDSHNAVRWF